MKNKLTRSLFGFSLVIFLGILNAQAQSNYLNFYNCNGIYESVPPNQYGMTSPAPSSANLTICGSNLQYAQELANSTFAPNSTPGWRMVGQCVLIRSSFSICTSPGLI